MHFFFLPTRVGVFCRRKHRLLAAACREERLFKMTRCSARKIRHCLKRRGNEDKRLFLHAKSYRHTKPRRCRWGEKKKRRVLTFFSARLFQINCSGKCVEKNRDSGRRIRDASRGGNEKTRGKNWERGEYTGSFIWPTIPAFHVWNLDIINNKSSRIQSRPLLGVKVHQWTQHRKHRRIAHNLPLPDFPAPV